MEKKHVLYKKIANEINIKIHNDEYKDDHLPSETELCRIYNVSRQTARNIYDCLLLEGLIIKLKGKGTYVNRNNNKVVVKKRYKIAVMTPDIDFFFAEVIKVLNQLAGEHNYEMIYFINDSFGKENDAVNKILSQNFDGVIYTPFRSEGNVHNGNYTRFIKAGLKTVMIGKPTDRMQINAVYVNDTIETYNCLGKVKNMGYQKVIHITDTSGDVEAVLERNDGYELAVKDFYKQDKFYKIDISSLTWKDDLMLLLDQINKPCLLFVYNDITAIKVYNVLNTLKYKIPEEIGVLGYDNNAYLLQLSITLSSIAPPKRLMGETAFNLLRNLLLNEDDGKWGVQHHIVKTTLQIRESIKK